MDKDYIFIVETLNEIIVDFNKFLDPKHFIPAFDMSEIDDNSIFTSLNKQSWDDLRFPNSEKRGVYFLVGYDSTNPTVRSIYIGKASFSSKIGKRLYAHLTKDRNNNIYTMRDVYGNDHILEYIFSIDLETSGSEVLSSSLEEYLIHKTKGKIYLLNGTGNNLI